MQDFTEFTEAGFVELLKRLDAGGYRFARYGEKSSDRHVLWRHDVDASIHRAAKLAQIEADRAAIATYFVNLRSPFYNLLEPEVERLLYRIHKCGHEIGLHFDAAAYSKTMWTEEELESAVRREKTFLENLIEVPIKVVSWHNPDLSNLLDFEMDDIGGLINSYGGSLRNDYTYCSDSNGYWRFKSMGHIIAQGYERLHLLTHPEWWTSEAMAPSERMDRAIFGRARNVRYAYDQLLARAGRRNVTDEG